jgi:hypothetical protein
MVQSPQSDPVHNLSEAAVDIPALGNTATKNNTLSGSFLLVGTFRQFVRCFLAMPHKHPPLSSLVPPLGVFALRFGRTARRARLDSPVQLYVLCLIFTRLIPISILN